MANNKDCDFRTSIGGQALIEGILMRGPKKQAIVCRTAEGLVEKVDELKLLKDKYPIFGWPFIRGCVTFIDSMIKGMQALTYSAELVPVEDQEPRHAHQQVRAHIRRLSAHGGDYGAELAAAEIEVLGGAVVCIFEAYRQHAQQIDDHCYKNPDHCRSHNTYPRFS